MRAAILHGLMDDGQPDLRSRRCAQVRAGLVLPTGGRCAYTHANRMILKERIFVESLEIEMPRGDKSSYTDKQKRQAEHVEQGYEQRGVAKAEAERRAWATVNKETGGGKKSGSGRGKAEDHSPSRKGGRAGGAATSSRSAAERSASAKKGAATRKRNAAAKTRASHAH